MSRSCGRPRRETSETAAAAPGRGVDSRAARGLRTAGVSGTGAGALDAAAPAARSPRRSAAGDPAGEYGNDVRPIWLPADHGLLRGEGWRVNAKRIERLWRREGLPARPPAETRSAVA